MSSMSPPVTHGRVELRESIEGKVMEDMEGMEGRARALRTSPDLIVVDGFAVGPKGDTDEHVASHSRIGVALEPFGDELAAVAELAVAES
jgi:hypothetical protein